MRFVYEAFRKLRPGTPLRCLHGGMKQVRSHPVWEGFPALLGTLVLGFWSGTSSDHTHCGSFECVKSVVGYPVMAAVFLLPCPLDAS